MVEALQEGTKLHAKYVDGEFYPAEVLTTSTSKKRAKAPVKVHFVGYGSEDDTWLPLVDLRSKKIPKAEAPAEQAKAKAKASPSACPPVAKAKAAPQALVAAAALLPARPKLIGAIRPSQSPRLPGSVAVRLTAASLAASVAPRGSALAAVPAPSRVVLKAGPGLSEGRAAAERRAMQALARHSARLGPAGPGLEAAVRAVLARAQGAGGQAALDLVERWDFLERQDGLAAFQALRRRFAESYDRLGRGLEGDREVLGLFSPPPARTPAPADGKPSAEVRDERWAPPPAAGVLGTLLELPPEDVRFAHNDQSERFGHGWRSGPGGGCVLQLTAELLAGLTQPSDVPEFSACWHEGGWFCRTGNRRLAAFRLAQRLAPKRFERLRVRAVAADESFARGVGGKRPKLTTQQNGEHCRGRWLVMRETQEVVGCARPGLREYGLDLLALLPFAEDGWGEPADGREVAGGA
mmetsp:Transcript_135572/g.329558  ORF Transcript_135572/g.329558 Transcript_135572/m.329558 type:complete len:466 (-) Transcript_135572:97-1494(-)